MNIPSAEIRGERYLGDGRGGFSGQAEAPRGKRLSLTNWPPAFYTGISISKGSKQLPIPARSPGLQLGDHYI